jgi:arylsulfatase A-like enzyme
MDVHATILDVAGAEPWRHQDSISVLSGPEREDVLGEVHAHYMLRNREWKIVVGRDGQTLQLFDLANDPNEQSNLCEHPDYKQEELEMRSRLLTRIARNTYRHGDVDPELSSHSIEGLTYH